MNWVTFLLDKPYFFKDIRSKACSLKSIEGLTRRKDLATMDRFSIDGVNNRGLNRKGCL
jgi:hypothetical protein